MSSSDVISTFINPDVADPNGLFTSGNPNAGALTLAGALVAGTVGTMDVPRNVTVTSGANIQTRTFAFTGTDELGNAQTETLTGVNNNTVVGTKSFKTVTGIVATGAAGGNMTVGSGTAVAAPMYGGRMRLRGIYAVNTANAGIITFREVSATGAIKMQFGTLGSATTSEYPDVPDDGILFRERGFVTYDLAQMSNLTVFFN